MMKDNILQFHVFQCFLIYPKHKTGKTDEVAFLIHAVILIQIKQYNQGYQLTKIWNNPRSPDS